MNRTRQPSVSPPPSSIPDAAEEAALRAVLKPVPKIDSHRRRYRELGFTQADEVTFNRVLQEAFPGMFFLVEERNNGVRSWCYYENLTDHNKWTRYCCVPQPGWTFEYFMASDNKVGRFPRLNFAYFGGVIVRFPHGRGRFPSAQLKPGAISGVYHAADTERARFIAKVWRLSQRIATNKVKIVDRYTG
jgi:hypothetical protein